MSKDKVPVMIYNKDMARICANGKFVMQFEFSKLPPISPKVYLNPIISVTQIDKDFVYELKKTDTKRLNSLAQLCEMLEKEDPEKKCWMYLELRDQVDDLKVSTYETLKKYGREERAIWRYSGGFGDATRFHEIGPEVPLQCGVI